jgi:hypothetical protein
MLEKIVQGLEAVERAQGAFGIFSGVARGILRLFGRRRSGAMTGGGIEFFPTRETLVRAHGTLGSRLKNVSSVSGMWVVGLKFLGARENIHVLKRLLLPHPDGDALKNYAKVSKHGEVIQYIKDATKQAQSNGTKVKWYREFVFASIVLVDTDKPTGWAHVELVMPYSQPENRPSFTIYKRQSEATVSELQRIFDEIWEVASVPPS